MSEVGFELKKQAAAAAGYYVRRRVTERNKFYFKNDSRGFCDGPVVVGEDAAWELAWKHLCLSRVVYQHKKGGIYVQVGLARLASGEGPDVMIYEHLAPHDPGLWVRDLAEFNEPGRFVRIVP